MIVRVTCPYCVKRFQVEVDKKAYDAWQDGMLIQDAFPDLTDNQRELIKTKICPGCWEKEIESVDE